MVPLYYNLRSLWARRLSTSLTVAGLSMVVFVFASVLMLSHGIEAALASGGSPQNAVVLRSGATSEVVSGIDRSAVLILAIEPQIASSSTGEPLVTGELVVLVALPRGPSAFINATARGISPASFEARPSVRIVEGRAPRPGSNEVALGNALAHQSAGTFVGGELEIASQRWPVVGRFVALGSAYESELWVDRDRLGDAFKRPGFSSAVARLTSPTAFDAFKASVEDDPRFKVKVMREDRYWEDQAASTATFIRVLGLFISSVFSIGAVLGAMITMYAQVAARTREVGMMRALGFSRRSVLAGFLVESALLGGAGGLLGAAAALAMGFVQIRTLNFQTFSQVRFGFTPTPGILLAALCFGAGMGFLGGMLPAVRAARLGVLEAVRS